MTDKELKKLSRLELLELLLEETRENERLREELEQIKRANTIEKSAKHLDVTSRQLETALQKVFSITSALKNGAVLQDEASEEEKEETALASDYEENPEEKTEQEESAEEKAEETEEPEKEEQLIPENTEKKTTEESVDVRIYKELIIYFVENPHMLNIFPEEIRRSVAERIDEIRNRNRFRRT